MSSTEPLKQPAPPQSQPTGLSESTSYGLPYTTQASQLQGPPQVTQQHTWPHSTLHGTSQSQSTQLPPPYTDSNPPTLNGGTVYSQQGGYFTNPSLPTNVGYGGLAMGGTQSPATKLQLVFLMI